RSCATRRSATRAAEPSGLERPDHPRGLDERGRGPVVAALRAPDPLIDRCGEGPVAQPVGVAAELLDQDVGTLADASPALVHVVQQLHRRIAEQRGRVELALADERPRVDEHAALVGERERAQSEIAVEQDAVALRRSERREQLRGVAYDLALE